MKILVANLGSTSFKYRLFDMTDERLLARGGVERIGSEQSACFVEANGNKDEFTIEAPNHAVAVQHCLEQLSDPNRACLTSPSELSAIGFKAVHAEGLTGAHRVTEDVLKAMEAYSDVAPAHNPPYVQAMRLLATELQSIPMVAAFETGFHETIPPAEKHYAVPWEWAEKYGIKKYGFHGASHRYIAERSREVLDNPQAKVISCHLGGSSSLCAIEAGQSRATTMGMSPQSGLPNNNRAGSFDPFAIPPLMRHTGMNLDQVLYALANESGLLGVSGISNDLRDIEEKASQGHERAQMAIDIFVAAIRHYLGAYMVLLNGIDAIIFTGGIGEKSATIRSAVCNSLEWHGIALDPEKNESANGEKAVHAEVSRAQIWTMPTNEEIIVARQAKTLLEQK